MSAMKAAFHTGAGKLDVRSVPMPVPSAGDALIRVRYCGICGTDKHTLMNNVPQSNYIPGHELSGVVDGIENDLSYQVGDHVMVHPIIGCGKCSVCQRGIWRECQNSRTVAYGLPGAFAEYITVPVRNLWKKPENISDAEAALAEPLAVAVHAISQINSKGQNTLVFGAGAIGLLVAQTLVAQGAQRVFIADINEDHLNVAAQLGSLIPIKADEPNSWNAISGVDIHIAFDVVGHSEVVLQQAVDALIPGGTLMLIGVTDPGTLDEEKARSKDLRIIRSMGTSVEDFDTASELLESGQVQCNPLISAIYPLDDINEALRASLSGIKVLVEGGR